MCMATGSKATFRWYERHKHLNRVKVWKGVNVIDGKIKSPIHTTFEYKPGEVKAKGRLYKPYGDRKRKCYLPTYIDAGLHVYMYNPDALRDWGDHTVMLYADPKDFVAADNYQMVFNKLTLTKREYNRVLKEAEG